MHGTGTMTTDRMVSLSNRILKGEVVPRRSKAQSAFSAVVVDRLDPTCVRLGVPSDKVQVVVSTGSRD